MIGGRYGKCVVTMEIILKPELLLGEGRHKVVYAHPTDEHKCIKIMKNAADTELQRELKYYKALARRGKQLSMMVQYYGEVSTNLGTGYVFEQVKDFDGTTSHELTAIFKDRENMEKLLGCTAQEVLRKFQQLCFEEKPVVSNMDPYNYMIQRLSPTEYTIRVIDNIGTPSHIPLAYYFDYFASKHIHKYWRRFVKKYAPLYPDIFSEEFLR